MAELCETYEVNCAAHNYHGWLGTAICAHFCAAIPNFKVRSGALAAAVRCCSRTQSASCHRQDSGLVQSRPSMFTPN